jgi:hypothetical protein
MNQKLPHHRFKTETKLLLSIDEKGKDVVATEKTGIVDMRMLSKIQQEHRDLEDIDIWEKHVTLAQGVMEDNC